jgi:hypothetical protein
MQLREECILKLITYHVKIQTKIVLGAIEKAGGTSR